MQLPDCFKVWLKSLVSVFVCILPRWEQLLGGLNKHVLRSVRVEQCPPRESCQYKGISMQDCYHNLTCKSVVLKLSAGTRLDSPPKHAQGRREQVHLFRWAERKASVFLRGGAAARSLCALQSWIFIPSHHKQWPPVLQALLNLSLNLCLRFSSAASRAILDSKSFTGSCSTASDVVDIRRGQASAPGRVL